MIGEIKMFNSFQLGEWQTVQAFASYAASNAGSLSGYLAGKDRGGPFVRMLEEAWAESFKVKHAIACNSATSGLYAAAVAIGLKPGDRFACPAMTMSATAAAPAMTGAKPHFLDVEDETFGLVGEAPHDAPVFVTNLFGHPARLRELRKQCDEKRTVLIEDNAQSPLSWDGDKFAGTIGHIGVFSLNVHKPLQCGEGGVLVTDDDVLAQRLRDVINHGETGGMHLGLNLRMPEVSAAIGLAQLRRGEDIVRSRIDQAMAIIAAVGDVVRLPQSRSRCRHVFYTIPFLIEHGLRSAFCQVLRDEGVPVVEGYVRPLYRLAPFQKFARPCPVAEALHDHRLFYIENTKWDFTLEQCEQIGAAFHKAAKVML